MVSLVQAKDLTELKHVDNHRLDGGIQRGKAVRHSISPKVDIRERPAYPVTEAANYLRIPESTLRWWVTGRYYRIQTGVRTVKPVIELPDSDALLLSFMNLVEAHVLDSIRRKHGVLLPKVRATLEFLKKHYRWKHPLAEEDFQTDGMSLFVEKYGNLIDASKAGQVAMQEVLAIYLQRIERDDTGLPIRLYPFTRKGDPHDPRVIVIDPRVCFGRPTVAGTNIAAAIVAERFHAGESVHELAIDYGRSPQEIEEAIRCEPRREAA